ncbi:MAG: cache domain-containing protein, partial [Magnetococcales bacterium]|nr:cache domain-containing protein [Magnetococcales bacterium]
MANTTGFRFRFHVGLTGFVITVSVLIALFTLLSVFYESRQAAHDRAQQLFQEASNNASNTFQSLLERSVLLAQTYATTDAVAATPAVSMDHPAYQTFKAILKADTSLYAVYVGHADDTFFQVIATRSDPLILKGLKAPAETLFVIRTIIGSGEQRQQTRLFIDADDQLLEKRPDPGFTYLPSARPWYQVATEHSDAQLSAPYVFYSTGELGITASRTLRQGKGVLAFDLTLTELQNFLTSRRISKHGALLVLDVGGRILASQGLPGAGRDSAQVAQESTRLKHLLQLRKAELIDQPIMREIDGEDQLFLLTRRELANGGAYYVAATAPLSDFTAYLTVIRNHILLITAGVLFLFTPLVILFSRHLSSSLRALSSHAERIRKFDFSKREQIHSSIIEVNHLAKAHDVMRQTIQERTEILKETQQKLEKLVGLGISLSEEKKLAMLLETILVGGKRLTFADAGTLYMRTESGDPNFEIVRT